jgi:hypothetical protein
LAGDEEKADVRFVAAKELPHARAVLLGLAARLDEMHRCRLATAANLLTMTPAPKGMVALGPALQSVFKVDIP